MSDVTETKGSKNFWERPEGLWGMCLAGLGIAGILWFLTWFVPMMLALGLGFLGLGIVWGTIGAIGYTVFTDNPLRQAILLKLQTTSRALRSAVINEDPIAILRLLQTKAKKRMEEFDELMMPVAESKRNVARAKSDYANKLKDLIAEQTYRQEQGDTDGASRTLAKIGKTQAYYNDMEAMEQQTAKMGEMLKKARKVIVEIIEDAEFEINNEEVHFKAVKSVNGAWKQLRSVFKAGTGEDELRAEALRSVADQCDARLGEIDQFMDEFKVTLDKVNTKDAIDAQKGKMALESLAQASNNLQLKAPEVQVINIPSINIGQAAKVPVNR